ncbi:MAG: hypothetical protein M1319_06780 [Chloroflexi bacterium]|nr:hypothetical protein [Chloroflexota bacterium]
MENGDSRPGGVILSHANPPGFSERRLVSDGTGVRQTVGVSLAAGRKPVNCIMAKDVHGVL